MDVTVCAECSNTQGNTVQNFSSTKHSLEHSDQITFLWIIEDIITCPPVCYNQYSSVAFSIEDSHKRKVLISLFNKVNFDFIVQISSFTGIFEASIHVCLLDYKFAISHERAETYYFYEGRGNAVGFENFLQKHQLSERRKKLLHNGDLILYGKITFFKNGVQHLEYIADESHFIKDLGSLLKNGTNADFQILVKGKEFLCHKAVLVTRSEFFEALLRNDMKEKSENILVLDDIEVDVFQQVLNYIYTNEVDISEANVVPILAAADKYLLQGLKMICEVKLYSYMSICNMPIIGAITNTFLLPNVEKTALYTWAIFKKHFNGQYVCQAYKSVDKNHADASTSKSQPSIISESDVNLDLQPVTENTLPFTDVLVSSNTHVLFQKKWIIRSFNDFVETKNVPLVYEMSNFEVGLSCSMAFEIVGYTPSIIMKITFTLISCKYGTDGFEFCISFVNYRGSEENINRRFNRVAVGQSREVFRLQFADQYYWKNYLQNGDLIIKFQLSERKNSLYHQKLPVLKNELVAEISTLLASTKLTDLIIRADGKEFPCHKAIVSCRSPFLAQMLENSPNRDVLELQDIDSNMFHKLLSYIYTDVCDSLETEAQELMYHASCFEMVHLKLMCEQTLISNLSIENALETLNFAISHSFFTLKQRSLLFIQAYLCEILNLPNSWNQIREYKLMAHMF